jgi:hypothetical protein
MHVHCEKKHVSACITDGLNPEDFNIHVHCEKNTQCTRKRMHYGRTES